MKKLIDSKLFIINFPLLFIVFILCLSCISKFNSTIPNLQPGQNEITFSKEAGGKRSFYISLPNNFSYSKKYKLLLIFPGTSTTGQEMYEFVGKINGTALGIEDNMQNTIFVYPDPKWRYFSGWEETLGGWLLGPNGGEAKGNEDISFVKELLSLLEKNYTIDQSRVFATGHSWGGDMTAVVGCFLGDKFKAIAPVAANRPYWFEPLDNSEFNCKGNVSVWTFYGTEDEHFANEEAYSGDYGIQQNNFWYSQLKCKNDSVPLNLGKHKEGYQYLGCNKTLRFTLYKPSFKGDSDQPGHQPPDYYTKAVAQWFASF